MQDIHISDDGRAGQDDPLYYFQALRLHDMASRLHSFTLGYGVKCLHSSPGHTSLLICFARTPGIRVGGNLATGHRLQASLTRTLSHGSPSRMYLGISYDCLLAWSHGLAWPQQTSLLIKNS